MNFKNQKGSTTVIVAIVILVILIVLGYSAFKKSPTQSVSESPKGTTDKEVVNSLPREEYLNNKFGFKLTLPPVWKGYKTDTRQDQVNNAITYLEFKVPTTVKNYGDGSGFVTPLTLAVYSLADWGKILAEEGPKPTYIIGNKTNIFAYSVWQDAPEDLKNTNFDIPAIINNFSLLK